MEEIVVASHRGARHFVHVPHDLSQRLTVLAVSTLLDCGIESSVLLETLPLMWRDPDLC
jgi:hypothetical protein